MPPLLPPRAAWRVASPSAYPERPETERLLEPGTDALPVRILVQQDGFVTGWDDGAMGFEEGGFWFSGRATSFRMVSTGEPAAGRDLRFVESMTVGRLLYAGFPLRHPTRTVSIRVALLEAPDRLGWKDETRLVAEIRRWWLRPEADPASQYPPLALRPGAALIRADPSFSTEVLAGLDSFARLFLRWPNAPLAGSTDAHRLRRVLAEEEA